MVYMKNVPGWERLLRGLTGLGMAGAGYLLFGLTWMGLGIAAMGVIVVVTGKIGFCPLCAMAGRRIDKAARK